MRVMVRLKCYKIQNDGVRDTHRSPMRVAPRSVAQLTSSALKCCSLAVFGLSLQCPWRWQSVFFLLNGEIEVLAVPRAASHDGCLQVVGCQ